MVADGITNALAANAVTLWLAYGCWRVRKNEKDLLGMLHALAPLGIIVALVLASR